MQSLPKRFTVTNSKLFRSIAAIIILFILSLPQSIAQGPTSTEEQKSRASFDSLVKEVRAMFDELLDVEIGWAALQARHISNVGYGVDNSIGLNRELRDTLEVIREIVQSEIFVKSMIQYDHFWTRLVNRKQYSPKENELERQHGELYSHNLKFDINFIPAWDTTIADDVDIAREKGQIGYTCEITVEGKGLFTAEISQEEMEKALNESISASTYTKIKSDAAPQINQGLFAGLGWLAEKFDYTPFKDPTNIERVEFRAPTALNYGFDAYNKALPGNYENTSINGKQYKVPWKSMAETGNDKILAAVIKKEKDKPSGDTLRFQSESGIPYTNVVQLSDTLYEITLPPIAMAGDFALQALYTYTDSTKKEVTITAGQANISGYLQQTMNVVIVPLADLPAGMSTTALQNELNAIYKQAATSWNVSIAPKKLVVEGVDPNSIDDGQSGMLSNYSDDQNAIIDAYKDENDIDKNTCYIFLSGTAKSGTSKCGFMPLKRQFGFIFTKSNCSSELAHTIAHELAHGPFRLYHTFSSENQYTRQQGSTNNLMDYADGTELNKYQWDLIHDPQNMIALFQDEEDVEDFNIVESIFINSDLAINDEIELGELKIKLLSLPVKTEENGTGCTYNVDKVEFNLVMNDEIVGEYSATINNANFSYKINCNTGGLRGVELNWEDPNGISIKDIGALDGMLTKIGLIITNEGKVFGDVLFNTELNEDKSLNSLITLRKGLTGQFAFNYVATNEEDDGLKGSFDFEGIENIQIDLTKDNKIIASISDGVLTSKGEITADITLAQPVDYIENGFNVSLMSLDGSITYNMAENVLNVNSINGSSSLNNFPGMDASLDFTFEKEEENVVATISSLDNIKFYGLNLEAKTLRVEMNNNLELLKITGENITASYSTESKKETLSGTFTIKNIVLAENTIQEFEGEGSVQYKDYGSIILSDGLYDSEDSYIQFGAEVDLSASENNKLKTTVESITIKPDGSFEIGEIAIDGQFEAGPLTIKFEGDQKPKNTSSKTTIDATVEVKVKQGEIDELISFETTVEYIKDKRRGFTYMKVLAEDLSTEFPEVYGINTKLQKVQLEYTLEEDDTKSFSGGVTFDASIDEDKNLYQELVVLKKGLSGTIEYNFDSEKDKLGSFDFSNVQGLEIHFVKDGKTVAVLSGTLSKEGMLTGNFEVKEKQSFKSAGFTMTIDKFDFNSTYDITSSEFTFNSGSGSMLVSEITGMQGNFALEIGYDGMDFTTKVKAEDHSLRFCNLELRNFDLKAKVDTDLNLSQINGGFTMRLDKDEPESEIAVTNVLILEGELKEFLIKTDVKYKTFSFKIQDAVYKEQKLTANAMVLIGPSHFEVSSFSIDNNGNVEVGGVNANFKKGVFEIGIETEIEDNRFKGSFNAMVSPKFGFGGKVNMGSMPCQVNPVNCKYGVYSFGYYDLEVDAVIPVGPISITSLGGRFGFNYNLLGATDDDGFGKPELGTYLAGFSIGLKDNANIVNIDASATYQWGGKSAILELEAGIQAPAIKPIIQGSGKVKYKMPHNEIFGDVSLTAQIPPSTGFILDANAKLNFKLVGNERKFEAELHKATVLKAMDYSGSFLYKTSHNNDGELLNRYGYLNGTAKYGFNSDFSAGGNTWSVDCGISFLLTAGFVTEFTEQELLEASFTGMLAANAYIDAKVLNCELKAEGKIKGNATVSYLSERNEWLLDASYKVFLSIEDLKEFERSGSYSQIIKP